MIFPKEIADFLSFFPEKKDVKDLPGRPYWQIYFDESIGRFEMVSGFYIEGQYERRSSKLSYYFKRNMFLPVIKDLIRERKADIRLDGIYLENKRIWSNDSEEGKGYILVHKGYFLGKLLIEENRIKENNLLFYSQRASSLESGSGAVPEKDIKEVIHEYIDREEGTWLEKL